MQTEAEAYDDYGPKDIELRDGEVYTTRITFPNVRLLTHECIQGPLCFRAAAYCASEGRVEDCDHWSCGAIINMPCELCFIETMEEVDANTSDEPPEWWELICEQSREVVRLWTEAGNPLDGRRCL